MLSYVIKLLLLFGGLFEKHEERKDLKLSRLLVWSIKKTNDENIETWFAKRWKAKNLKLWAPFLSQPRSLKKYWNVYLSER